ncbi:MAG: transposase [Phycisphaerales bacterium]|nr:transposase [Phycisphaerales bacterium]
MALLAYFLTWHTYGTWLHGDERGSVNKIQNIPGTPLVSANPDVVATMGARMKHTSFVLDEAMQQVVSGAIRDHATIRRWSVVALNVRSNHVHVIVRPPTEHTPEAVMQQFKSWGTRRLIKAGFATSETRVWVDHGSTRYIDSEESLKKAVEYVENQ